MTHAASTRLAKKSKLLKPKPLNHKPLNPKPSVCVFFFVCVTDLRVTSYCSHTVAVTTVTFRQICPKRTLTLASTCQSFMQAVQHSVSGAVYISPIHMLQHSMLHSLDCGVHTSPEEEDVQANSAVIPALRLQTFCFRPT